MSRTRHLLKDLRDGREVPHLLIQPQFTLPTGSGGGPSEYEYVSLDFAVFDPGRGMYVPGEGEELHRPGEWPNPTTSDLTRCQAATQILALGAKRRW